MKKLIFFLGLRQVNAIKVILISLVICLVWMTTAVMADDDYVVGDGDSLQVSVWGESQLNSGVTVRPDGKITLPAIGDVTASGYTPTVLSAKLAEKLQEVVKKPIVTVTVTHITNNKIYILGGGVLPSGPSSSDGASSGSNKENLSILTSGVHNLPGRTTLLKFLSGLGVLSSADLESGYILRDGKKLNVDFYALFIEADLTKDIPLKAEDIIYLPSNEHNRIYIMGAVNGPKNVGYKKGLRILDVILAAGGFNKFARENSVVVMRREANSDTMKEIIVKAKDLMKDGDLSQNIVMMPGDFVIVKESIF